METVKKRAVKLSAGKIISYFILILHSFITLYPMYIMVITSFKTNKEIFKKPFSLPDSFSTASYEKALSLNNVWQLLLNSVSVTFISVALFLMVSLLAAYALSRFRFRLNRFVYIYFLLGMMVPIRLGVINLFGIFNKLNLYNTRRGLICIYTAMSIGFSVFILTGFMKKIPKELEEAAQIDGCGRLKTLFSIFLPILKPALATTIIYNAVPIWNDFYFPLIFIQDEALKTIPLGVTIFYGQFQTDWSTVFAALTLAAFPILVFYFMMSKQFISGLTAGAVKG